MDLLRLLLPAPVQWNTDNVQGELFVYGDLQNNRLRFSFRFDSRLQPVPLMVSYTDGKTQYKSSLSIIDDERKSANSFIFNPSFLIKNGVEITKISSLIMISEGGAE